MFNNFGVHVSQLFRIAEEERCFLKHPYVGTEHLFLAILKNDKEMEDFFKKYNLTYNVFKNELINVVGSATVKSDLVLYTPLLKRIINNALEDAKENNNGIVTARHLILAIFEEGEGIALRLLVGLNIDIDKIYDELRNHKKLTNKKLELLEIGTVLNDVVSKDEVVVGRDKEIEQLIETLLRKKKNNPLLIGDAGVGKTAIVEEFVRRIEKKEVPEYLLNTKVILLEMGSLVSGTKYRGEFEEKLTKIIKELEENNNMIIFIDEIHSMVNAGGAEGAITAGDIFKPALARGKIKCIGATTKEEYLKYFSPDKALMRRFEVINVDEPEKEETKNILLKIKGEYEKHHNVIVTNEIIDSIVYYANKFINNKKNPDKSIDFLDSVCAKAKTSNNIIKEKNCLYKELEKLEKDKNNCIKNSDYDKALRIYKEKKKIEALISNYSNNKKTIVKESDVIDVLENKTNMYFTEEKLEFLNNIETIINKELFGVSKYTNRIVELIRNNLLNKRGFLKVYLEGEEYLGKSSIVKIIAKNYPKCNFIRINLKEYTSKEDINKLIGTHQGFVGYNDEHLFSKLKNNTFSIILFDNYNNAHPLIQNLIKDILKEKYIIDNKGDKIFFNNTFIFITDDISKNRKVGFNNSFIEDEYNELYSLVDDVIKFDPLKESDLIKYLDYKNVKEKEKIINKSDYKLYNYKNIDKLIKEETLINN